jgi:hypothetical protein
MYLLVYHLFYFIKMHGDNSVKLPVLFTYIRHTQKNGADLIVNTIKTAPFFCVYSVYAKNVIILQLEQNYK